MIASKDNPAMKAARKLYERKGREQAGAVLVEGRKLISEALSAGFTVENLFINASALASGEVSEGEWTEWPGWFTDTAAAVGAANTAGAKETVLEEKLFRDLARTESPQPYMAVIRKPAAAAGQKSEAERVLILDRVGDPGNAGTMIRTALAAGMDEVWCVKGTADAFSDKVIRASAGTVFHTKLRERLSVEECLGLARSGGMRLIVCDIRGENIYSVDMAGRVAIVVGSEAGGPRKAFLDAADAIAEIPMGEKTESLNAAVAAAIVMYEIKRRSDRASE